MKRLKITEWCHERILQVMPHPTHCLDATAGTGRDTLFLLELTGPGGKVAAMDIQQPALDETARRVSGSLKDIRIREKTSGELRAGQDDKKDRDEDFDPDQRELLLILDGHEHMDAYFLPESLDLILFNLGYLPGGDHSLATRPDTTLEALNQSLRLLLRGGLLSVLVYSGGDSGFEEKDAVLKWAGQLDPKQYLVIVEEFYNRPNHPPIPVFIVKL